MLKENNQLLGLSLMKLLRSLTRKHDIENPEILELGAGTGYLSRTLMTMYGGNTTMIDSCEESYKAFKRTITNITDNVHYEMCDIFKYSSKKKYDIVCSFGVIEHFENKDEILKIHKKFCKEDGIIIVIVPMDTILTRLYYNSFPEKNLGYRELLSKKDLTKQIKKSGLEVLNVEVSENYVYDFIAAVCK